MINNSTVRSHARRFSCVTESLKTPVIDSRTMDDGAKSVLVAALSVYAELLAKNTERLDLEQGKGKGKAAEDDVDLKEEIRKQIKICGDLNNRITDPESSKNVVQSLIAGPIEPWGELKEDPGKGSPEYTLGFVDNWENNSAEKSDRSISKSIQSPAKSSETSQIAYDFEEEPYINPFTGLTVLPETGYEAGPSNRLPPPLRTAPKPPIIPPRCGRRFSEPPVQPPPKPMHLHVGSVTHAQETPPLSVALPPERPAPPPPPTSSYSTLSRSATLPPRMPLIPPPQPPAPEPPSSQTKITDFPLPLGYDLTPRNNITQEIAREQYAPIVPSYKSPGTSSTASIHQPTPSFSPYDWEAEIQDVREAGPSYQGQIVNTTHKNRYLRYIADLASKALKATGSIRSISRTTSMDQSISQTKDSTLVGSRHQQLGVQAEEPADLPEYSSSSEAVLVTPRRQSQESLPPAYETLSIHRNSSFASTVSDARSRMWSLSSGLSSRTSISPTSPSTSSTSVPQFDSNQNSRKTSHTSLNFNLRKRDNQLSTSPIATSPQSSSALSPALPNINQVVTDDDNSATAHPTLKVNPYSIKSWSTSSVVEVPRKDIDRRPAINTASPWQLGSSNFAQAQLIADAMLARQLSLDHSHDSTLKSTDTPAQQSQRNTEGPVKKPSSARIQPSSPPSSSQPGKDQLEADQEFARQLQLEEERELQIERDVLLAYKVANGTADDGDRELAYFLYQDTARRVESKTSGAKSSTQVDSNMLLPTAEDLRARQDWLKAHELDKEMKARIKADEASFLEAKKLQEQFDQEAKNEEAWEQWKGRNIDTCASCLEEHGREELVRECEHGYCNTCLQAAFKAALASRAPFKCCKRALQIKDCSGLNAEFTMEYEEMILELSTPNPLFCPNTKCAKFVPPRLIVGDVATCEKCSKKTCRHCRKKIHPGSFCAEDKETEAVKVLAKEKGWKTCPGCNHLIERSRGCLHMICSRCQTAFCYRCSKPWKDCESTCPDPISATHPKR